MKTIISITKILNQKGICLLGKTIKRKNKEQA